MPDRREFLVGGLMAAAGWSSTGGAPGPAGSPARFEPQIPQSVIDDLRRRLLHCRLPDALPGVGWRYGADDEWLRRVREHWMNRFDWRKQERAFGRFRHFGVTLDDQFVHFIHERGEGPRPLPLVLTHGWPGSFLEFARILPMLTHPGRYGGDPSDAFDVVVPSLPGFGFSGRPVRPGMDAFRNAELWVKLMGALGYRRFGAQGGDLGAGVSTALGLRHPEHVVGIHLNYVPGSYAPPGPVSQREREWLQAVEAWDEAEGAYSHVQSTEPQILGAALNDSPMGLAAWILTKFRSWSDCGGVLERRFDLDELLTNVSLYWFTETITSSFRRYLDGSRAPLRLREGERVAVPCGFAHFPKELPYPPRERVEKGYDVRRWTEMPRGGHFAAMEEPELLAEDVRALLPATPRLTHPLQMKRLDCSSSPR